MPFVAINCGALPETLIESELFGHRKGAFTGADEHRVGLFEVANGGTLFLDEIGELPKAMQAKLLRFLESGEIRRVGENESFRSTCASICATHRHLREMVDDGRFPRRLDVPHQHVRDSRAGAARADRRSAGLGRHLVRRFRLRHAQQRNVLHARSARALLKHTLAGQRPRAGQRDRARLILCDRCRFGPSICRSGFAGQVAKAPSGRGKLGPITLGELEMQAIHEALERHDGNKPKAAEELGISLKTLYNKLNQNLLQDRAAA